jgi:hemerythrin-like domain-containing protein
MTQATVQLHPSPGAGFDSPFEMLAACHERVTRMLGLLQRLRAHLQSTGHADAPAAEAARDVMRYFDLAAPHHHQDEERHVFPVLREAGEPGLAALAEQLTQEHLTMHEAWLALRPTLADLGSGHWAGALAESVFGQWQAFQALYHQHAQIEDDVAYPAALARLDASQCQAMGDEMARRRGVRN